MVLSECKRERLRVAGTVRVSWIRRYCILWTFSVAPFLWSQEFRSTTTVTSASQLVTVDLTNLSDSHGASISIHNSGSSTILLPQISTANNLMPISGSAILAQLASLPPVSTDQDRAIQAWQYVIAHTTHVCGAGGNTPTYDALTILDGYGFGCCDQLATTLAWIWQQEGYQSRVAYLLNFHDVPEISYGGAWHVLDPDHNVYYPKDDGTIASVEEIIATPTLVSRVADANGNDPVGWPAADMAQRYVDAAPTLVYRAPVSPASASTISLRPHETLIFNSENEKDSAVFFNEGTGVVPDSVGAAQLVWDLSFGNPSWSQYPYAGSAVQVITDSSGNKFLTTNSSNPGYLIYRGSSAFPMAGLLVAAQLGSTIGGSLNAYFSTDGITWSPAVSFQPTMTQSAFDLMANLSPLARGFESYFVKLELHGGIAVHRLRIKASLQTSRFLFPPLMATSSNQLLYQDASPVAQSRLLKVTSAIQTGRPQIRGLHAVSLAPESPTYSLARDYGAANLVDRDADSLAYPGSTHLDYLIQLNGLHTVTGVSVDWGYYGSNSQYLQNWQILGRSWRQPWQQLAAGGSPGQSTLDVPLSGTFTELRLVANGANWIGAYELRVFGGSAAPPLSKPSWTVVSNVPEDKTYSITAGYRAANLIDDNADTLAYPGSTNIDYQIGLGTLTHLQAATITWGYFGTDSRYISSWSLLARNGAAQPWSTVAQGGFPNNTTSQITLDCFATDVRIVASSTQNWIGVYELTLAGSQALGGITAASQVQQQLTLAGTGPASNLTDGDPTTVAYPGSRFIDYALDPGIMSYFDTAAVTWGMFGTSPGYVQPWRLLGLSEDGSTWDVLARGGFPNAAETDVVVQNRYRKLRLVAEGTNWIGAYEVQLSGNKLPPQSAYSVKSNVFEDPVYSLALGYQAANLIDGNPGTLAYPASTHLDYQISLSGPSQLSSVLIDWGTFGSDPLYVSSWSLLGRSGASQPWVTLAQGGFPNGVITFLNTNATVTDLRIVADSANWIGIYEVGIRATPQ